jgi:hypothetical protein
MIYTYTRGHPRALNTSVFRPLIAADAHRKSILDESAARVAAAEVTAD